jgi:hypothetical protein
VKFQIHSLSTEELSPFQETNHADSGEAHGECHQIQDRWDESIRYSPVVEEEDHSELLMSARLLHSILTTHAESVLDDCGRFHDLFWDIVYQRMAYYSEIRMLFLWNS